MTPEQHKRDDTLVLVERSMNPYLVIFHEPDGFRAEQVRGLRNKLLVMNPDGASRSLVVASAIQGEGKTATTLNLAIAMSEVEDHRIIVLDFDLRRPRVEDFLGLDRGPGLNELLTGSVELETVIRSSGIAGLDVIGAGVRAVPPSELVSSRRVDELLGRLKEEYNYILIDTPPSLPLTDAGVLSAKSDGTLLVVALEKSPRSLVKEALSNLQDLGANMLGTFVTGIRGADPSSDRRYRYYSEEE